MEHQIEPELQSSPPRNVESKDCFFLWFLLAYGVPIAISLAALYGLGFMYLDTFYTRTIDGTITARNIVWGRHPSAYSWVMAYTVNGRQYTADCPVGPERFATADVGAHEPLIISPMVPRFKPRLPNENFRLYSFLALATFATVILSGASFTFAIRRVRTFLRSKWLCTNGIATEASVRSRSVSWLAPFSRSSVAAGMPNNWDIEYIFSAPNPQSGQATDYFGQAWVPEGSMLYSRSKQGDKFTVLYSPADPSLSIPYLLSEHRPV